MIRLLPILLIVLYGLLAWQFSAWRLRHQLDNNSRPLREPSLDPVLAKLCTALDMPALPVHIYQIETVNGLAAPDGRVFLTEGFLRKYRNTEVTAEEIASVIAHELGHVALGHARRRMIDFSGQNVVRAVLMGLLGRVIPVFGPMLANLIAVALAARLSRQDEFEADAFASALMIGSGLGTAPQISLFRKLDRLASAGRAAIPAWLLTHPATTRRIAAIEANTARWQSKSY